MRVIPTSIEDVKIIEPDFFGDERGFFFESYNQKKLKETASIHEEFVQDNHSRSAKFVLRGLHYQINNPQGKLVRVVSGEVYDVAVDLRKSSKTFGKWVGVFLSEQNKRMLYVPQGFAHGFLVLSESADFLYKTTSFYDPSSERALKWDDEDLKIEWPLKQDEKPILSLKDLKASTFKTAELFS
ncbi:MAG TPA: dTDP-4-dehydrorhamnose 3,5-epimerase [Parachlamydiaceae bacterium]|nr:dTDP-4-dehydrorhamnose 3,5-epimerase [Parachlamydiaceae bacterium]